MKITSRYKMVYVVLTGVLLGGIFVYTTGMFFLNLFISPESLLEHGTEMAEQAELRLALVKILGRGYGVAQTIYVCGGILYLGFFWKSDVRIPVKYIFSGFLLSIVGIALILLPFMLLDESWREDYLFVSYGILSWHCIIFSILLLMNCVKKGCDVDG